MLNGIPFVIINLNFSSQNRVPMPVCIMSCRHQHLFGPQTKQTVVEREPSTGMESKLMCVAGICFTNSNDCFAVVIFLKNSCFPSKQKEHKILCTWKLFFTPSNRLAQHLFFASEKCCVQKWNKRLSDDDICLCCLYSCQTHFPGFHCCFACPKWPGVWLTGKGIQQKALCHLVTLKHLANSIIVDSPNRVTDRPTKYECEEVLYSKAWKADIVVLRLLIQHKLPYECIQAS